MNLHELQHDDYKSFKQIKNCVYMFMSPSGKSYIGITNNLYDRYVSHRRESNKNKNYKKKFYAACMKYNFYNFKIYLLEHDIQDEELLKFMEVLFIEKYKTQDKNFGYNMTPGGDGTRLFGEKNGMFGKKHTSESKEKMKENSFGILGSDNYWHASNRTKEELDERFQKSYNSRLNNISKLNETQKKELIFRNSQSAKKCWKNINNNNMNNSLNALKYWEYKCEDELKIINAKKSLPGELNGRALVFIIKSPSGEEFEVCLDKNLKIFCEEHNLIYRALYKCINKNKVDYPTNNDTKFYSDVEYSKKRLNTVGWKITKFRRSNYEINV